ncbi:unnamed protein product [Parajaminaea phylloscopi]
MPHPAAFSSPASTMAGGKVGGQPDDFVREEGGVNADNNGISDEDIPYDDSEGETEQPHELPSIHQPAHGAEHFIRVGKGGSRAQPGSVPPRATSLAPPISVGMAHQTSQDRSGPSQWAPGENPRRMAGGLSGRVGATAAQGGATSGLAPPMQRLDSSRSADAGSSFAGEGSVSGRSLYRPAGAGYRSDLTDWAPRAAPVMQDTAIENLPNWNTMKPGDSTSKPISRVEKDMDWSFRRLISESVFQKLLEDPLGRHRFRNFLDSQEGGGGAEILDFYFDLGQYNRQATHLKETTEALHDLYLAEDSDDHVPLPSEFGDRLYDTLRRTFDMQISLTPMQEHIRQSLYKNQFQRFIRSMIVEQHRVKLGTFQDENEEYTGLGDCFCLTNPRAGSENPIVLVSPGFAEVTGYPTRAILGRNCRFLQGPGTAPDSVQRIRDALNAGRSCTELLLNYRRDGTPFFCLLSIIPLRDREGRLVYFIGGQTNVTGTLASSKGLGFLVGSDIATGAEPEAQTRNGYEISQTMARHLVSKQDGEGLSDESGALVAGRPAQMRSKSSGARKKGVAAGAYDPTNAQGPGNDLFANELGGANRNSGGRQGGFMSRLLGRGGRNSMGTGISNVSSGIGSTNSGRNVASRSTAQIHLSGGPPKQRLMGAEGVVRGAAPARLSDQMEFFADLYSRIIIFKRQKREIIFATRPILEALDLPAKSAKDVYDSPLLHADVLSLMQGSSKAETRALRQAVADACRHGRQISVMTGLRRPKTGLISSLRSGGEDDIITYRALHITPLHDRDNSSFAFVAVLG